MFSAYLYRVLILVVVLGACSGCLGTMFNQMDYWSDNFGEGDSSNGMTPLGNVWIYGGTVTDICYLSSYAGFPLSKTGDLEFLLALPFDFAADTVLLPMTIIQQIVGRPGEQDKETAPIDEERQDQPQPEGAQIPQAGVERRMSA